MTLPDRPIVAIPEIFWLRARGLGVPFEGSGKVALLF